MSTSTDCLHCIDGMALASSPLMGSCFRVCPTCQPQCGCCNGEGRFPAWTRDMAAFVATYNADGLVPALCHNCGGVVGASPLDEQDTPT